MDALVNIARRASAVKLEGECPSEIEISAMMRCAVNAPDHGRLRPWRFLVIKGAGLNALGELFATAEHALDSAASEQERVKARRSPLVIVAIQKLVAASRISEFEQTLAVGAAVENLILAAHAFGYGTMWRTGRLSTDKSVREGLGLSDHERIAGFIHIGIDSSRKAAPRPDPRPYFSDWPCLDPVSKPMPNERCV